MRSVSEARGARGIAMREAYLPSPTDNASDMTAHKIEPGTGWAAGGADAASTEPVCHGAAWPRT